MGSTSPPSINHDGLTFDRWLEKANDYIAERLDGMTLDDLPDRNTWDAWNGGEDPIDFARETLEEEGYTGEDDDNDE